MKLTASFQNRLSHQRHSLHPLHQWEFCLWCFWCLKDPGLLPLLPSFFLLLPSLGAKTRRKEKCVNSSAVALHSYKSSARRHLIGSHKKAGWVSVEKELHCSVTCEGDIPPSTGWFLQPLCTSEEHTAVKVVFTTSWLTVHLSVVVVVENTLPQHNCNVSYVWLSYLDYNV